MLCRAYSRSSLLPVCTAALILALVAAGCSPSGPGKGPGGRSAGPAPVLTAVAQQKTVPVVLRAIGTVEAMATVSVRAQVQGNLSEIHFVEGQEVKQGDLLFSIDRRPYEQNLRQAEAAIRKGRAQLAVTGREARQADELHRAGIISDNTRERASASAEAQDAAQAANQAYLDNARLQLSYCSITAPITGRTGKRLVDVGNLVRPGEQTLVVINQVRPIQVRFSEPEMNLGRIRGRMAAGTLPVLAYITGESEPARGELTFIDNAVDPQTGTILLKATFANDDERLWPGQFVDVELTLAEEKDAVVVPTRAVQDGQQGTFVFAVQADRTVEVVPVTVGFTMGEETVIAQGLSAGREVVIDGQLRLTPGAAVEVKSALGEAGAPTPAQGPAK